MKFGERENRRISKPLEAVMEQAAKEPMHKYTINIPVSVWRKLKAKMAHDQDYKDVSKYINTQIKKYLNE